MLQSSKTQSWKCGAALLIVINGGMSVKPVDARLQRRLTGLFDGPFLGTPTLIGPWGCPAALPHHQGLTDSSNEACHHWESARQQTSIGLCDVHRVLISRQWRGGKKKTPVGDRQPWPAFEYFSIYHVSVLSIGDAQKRHTGGWQWWIFYKSKGRGGKKRSPAGVGFCRLSYECHYMWLSLCWVIITFFPVLVHFS